MRIGFIGVGGIAGNYRESLRRLGKPVAAVCDINPQRVEEISAIEKASPYTDHREMLAKEKLDVLFVAIPPGFHTTEVIDAARSGAALFVAKPIGLDWDLVRRTRDVIQEAGVLNQVGYMARYSDITEKARQVVGDRSLAMGVGRFLCRMGASHPWWGKLSLSGGQMLEQSTHVFDLLRYLVGEVQSVQAFGRKGVSSEGIADFEEVTVCNLHFVNGAVGNVTSTCIARAHDGFAAELIGDDLYLHLTMDTHLRGNVGGEVIEFTGVETGYFRQVEQFIKAVEANDQSLVRSSYADAAQTLGVTLAANRSLETGKVEEV